MTDRLPVMAAENSVGRRDWLVGESHGQIVTGDPRWDLARIQLWDGTAAMDALLDGYGATVTREERRDLLPIYLLAFITHHAVGHDRPDYIRLLLQKSRYEDLL